MKSVLYLSLGMGLLACGQKKQPVSSAQKNLVSVQTFSKEDSNSRLKDFEVRPVNFTIYPSADTTLNIGKRGTVLHIPKNAFVNAEGEVVKDAVSIEFKEYTNAAEMAFSGIPMSFKQSGKDFFFSSSGMFDISGSANGKPVAIAEGKALKIDYALVKKNTDLAFYEMDKNVNAWNKLRDIKQQFIEKPSVPQAPVDPFKIKYIIVPPSASNLSLFWTDNKSRTHTFTTMFRTRFSDTSTLLQYLKTHRDHYLSFFFSVDTSTGRISSVGSDNFNPVKNYDKEIMTAIQSLSPCKIKHGKMDRDALSYAQDHFELQVRLTYSGEKEDEEWIETAPLYAGNAGVYSGIVTGLQISSFGRYNCDRIFQFAQGVDVAVKFFDSANNEIRKLYRVSVIDIKNNLAYTCDPTHLLCDYRGPANLLLATTDGKMYVLAGTKSYAELGQDPLGVFSLKVHDVTNTIKCTNDLAQYLKISL